MIQRQHTPLIFIEGGAARALRPIPLQLNKDAGGYNDAWLRDLVFDHPSSIPIDEIDPSFGPLIPVCRELFLRGAGPVDAFFINRLGMPTIVECKLWRNPEARREVVGQILDYARVLRRWTYNDLQRESASALKIQGFDLADHVRRMDDPDLDEAVFVDNVTRNLASGRYLLLVLGDGIREGVEAIAEYIQGTTGLHFTFGLVDTKIFDAGEGRLVIQPRILAKTFLINRGVVSINDPRIVFEDPDADVASIDEERPRVARDPDASKWIMDFWTEVLEGLQLDDVEQRIPKPRPESPLFKMASGNVWLRCTISKGRNEVGIYLDGMVARSDIAVEILRRLNDDREAILVELGLPPEELMPDRIGASRSVGDLTAPSDRRQAIDWLTSVINDFVNAIRPRVLQAFDDLKGG